MIFGPKKRSVARHDDFPNSELMNFMIPLETHHLDKPVQKELSLFSKKNYTYVDNRKIDVKTYNNCTFIIYL